MFFQECPEDSFRCIKNNGTISCGQLQEKIVRIFKETDFEDVCIKCSLQFRGCETCDPTGCTKYK